VTTFHRYLAKRLLAASGIATLAVAAPLILTVVGIEVPASLLYSKLAWPILYGIVPTALYFILPVVVSIAITWCYGALVGDFAHGIQREAVKS
jgi:lipopolysaccharide export LptBFGC system permease protein LptF